MISSELLASGADVLTVFGARQNEVATSTGMTSRIFDERNSPMRNFLLRFWTDDQGQDIAEYAVMLAVILVLVVGTVRLVGSNANNAFSSVASSLQ